MSRAEMMPAAARTSVRACGPRAGADDASDRVEIERRHWWFRGRRRVLEAVLADEPPARPGRVLDAGCGAGGNLALLARLGAVDGVDTDPARVRAAAGVPGAASALVAPADALPFPDAHFGFAACLDVLEHVPDDRAALRELRRVVATGGRLLVTVPACPRAWSGHDEASGHLRRYRADALITAAEASGWSVRRTTHLNALLLPPALAARRLLRGRGTPRSDLHRTPRWADAQLEWPLRLEAALIARGTTLPAGLSLLAVFEAVPRPAR